MSIEAIKQMVKMLEEIHVGNVTPMAEKVWHRAIAIGRKAIAEAEKQEPVAWLNPVWPAYCGPVSPVTTYETYGWRPLYTSPPQRQPLTDEQIIALSYDGNKFCIVCDDDDAILKFARAIEAAHGIKGEA